MFPWPSRALPKAPHAPARAKSRERARGDETACLAEALVKVEALAMRAAVCVFHVAPLFNIDVEAGDWAGFKRWSGNRSQDRFLFLLNLAQLVALHLRQP
jgi:hypothetical protein